MSGLLACLPASIQFECATRYTHPTMAERRLPAIVYEVARKSSRGTWGRPADVREIATPLDRIGRPNAVLTPIRNLAKALLAAITLMIVPDATTSGCAADPADEKGFVPLFNGRDLSGWEGNPDLWKVEDGMIVGRSPGIRHNDFLATKTIYGDFELRLEFRLHDGAGNSGVQFRSEREPKSTAVIGYQADIGQQYWGCLYDEHRRRKVLAQAPKALAKVLKKDDWNTYVIRAEGDRVVLKINGLETVDYRESDKDVARRGIIALQIHSGPAMRIDFRNLRIRVLDSDENRF